MTSSPSFINALIAVGAVYHTVILCFSMNEYQPSAVKPESSTHCVIPLDHGPIMPYDVPVTQPGSAVHQYISSSVRSSEYLVVMYCEIIE